MKRATFFYLPAVLLVACLAYVVAKDRSTEKGGKNMTAPSNTPQQTKDGPAAQQTEDGPAAARRSNRLAGQASPYLRQHAHNPVDWYPWGQEALDRARKENKPIFLSIGYSSCHWCHVMERESFEDPETARILAEHFIAIKVDRQQRPDLDEIYMTAVQLMTGRGGWPLSVFLTPELKPFFGGTYFPPQDRSGMPGFKTVLTRVAQAWREQPDEVADAAGRLFQAVEAHATPQASRSGVPDASALTGAVAELRREFDGEWGGFGGAPKFPPSGAIALLLRQHARTGEDDLIEMVTVTLDRMAGGGIYDHLGGGFHRYSVDAQWLVPHFEKMLYDNALLSRVYLEAWQATHKDLYRRVAAQTLDYVLREMTNRRGGFHSAEDADSEAEEGKFYVWRTDEIKAVLGEEDGELFCRCYGVSEQGNFEGHNVLSARYRRPEFLHGRGISAEQLEDRLKRLRGKLLAERARRPRPGRDDAVLAAWNGMMISALSRGYQVLGDDRYLKAAQRAADFVLAEMVRDGVLLRTCGSGGELPGYLDDYAEMAGGLIDLYEAGFQRRWLEAADGLAGRMVAGFWDRQQGGFFYTSESHKNLLVRTKPLYDGAVPSGNSTAAVVLMRLSRLLDKPDYASKAEAILRFAGDGIRAQPRAHLDLLCGLDFHLHPGQQIAIAGRPDGQDTGELLRIIHGRFLPNKIMVLADPGAAGGEQAGDLVPLLRGKRMIAGKTTVYVCENFTCLQPVSDGEALRAMLEDNRETNR